MHGVVEMKCIVHSMQHTSFRPHHTDYYTFRDGMKNGYTFRLHAPFQSLPWSFLSLQTAYIQQEEKRKTMKKIIVPNENDDEKFRGTVFICFFPLFFLFLNLSFNIMCFTYPDGFIEPLQQFSNSHHNYCNLHEWILCNLLLLYGSSFVVIMEWSHIVMQTSMKHTKRLKFRLFEHTFCGCHGPVEFLNSRTGDSNQLFTSLDGIVALQKKETMIWLRRHSALNCGLFVKYNLICCTHTHTRTQAQAYTYHWWRRSLGSCVSCLLSARPSTV